MKRSILWGVVLLCAGVAILWRPSQGGPHPQAADQIDYDLNPAHERLVERVPSHPGSPSPYGLIVYIDPGDTPSGPPPGWASVLDAENLLFVAPLAAGNQQDVPRRLGLAILAARRMMQQYAVDPNRVFAAGFSGGARMAGRLAFYRPDLFKGTIQSCGADFYQAVPRLYATQATRDSYGEYGLLEATPEQRIQARRAKFTFITGAGDFRHGNILDIYYGGYEKFGYSSKLFDVADMGTPACLCRFSGEGFELSSSYASINLQGKQAVLFREKGPKSFCDWLARRPPCFCQCERLHGEVCVRAGQSQKLLRRR